MKGVFETSKSVRQGEPTMSMVTKPSTLALPRATRSRRLWRFVAVVAYCSTSLLAQVASGDEIPTALRSLAQEDNKEQKNGSDSPAPDSYESPPATRSHRPLRGESSFAVENTAPTGPPAFMTNSTKSASAELTARRKKLVDEYNALTVTLSHINKQLEQAQNGYSRGAGLSRTKDRRVANTKENLFRDANNKGLIVSINKKGMQVRTRLRAITREVNKIDEELKSKPAEPKKTDKNPGM